MDAKPNNKQQSLLNKAKSILGYRKSGMANGFKDAKITHYTVLT